MAEWIKEGIPAWHLPHKCWVLIERVYETDTGDMGNCRVRYVDGGYGTCNNWQLSQQPPSEVNENGR